MENKTEMSALEQARTEIENEIALKTQELEKLQYNLGKLNEMLGDSSTPAPTRKKPGPKPKAEATSEEPKVRKKPGPKPKVKPEGSVEEPKVRKKPGPKPKPKAEKEAAPKTAGASRAAEGRRAVARGDRPSIKQAIVQVMGTDVCNAEEVYKRVEAKGWLPSASDPKVYIGYTLSSQKEIFDRVPAKGRGFYRVKAEAVAPVEVKPEASVETKPVEAATVEVKPATPEVKREVTNGASKKPSTDDVLKEAGINLGGPFGG